MGGPAEGANLDVREDEAFQRRDWRAQRVGWVFFALALLAALFGLFGGGPLSSATREGDGCALHYERFARRTRQITLTVLVAAAPGERFDIEVAGAFFEDARIQRIEPAPETETGIYDGRRFGIQAAAGEPVRIDLHVTPQSPGRFDGRVRVGQGEWLSFSTLVYP